MKPFDRTPTQLGEGPFLDPLPCDRWIARSCFQKAIRRGDVSLAVRALANLFLHDPAGVWRHLTIVALEDIGVINTDLLRQIVDAKSKSGSWRLPGALWKTQVELTQALARSNHCQAVCDLLLRIENDPALSDEKQRICQAGTPEWAKALYDGSAAMERRSIAALCFGGFMNVCRPPDPPAVFEIFGESGCPEISSLAHSSWRTSRNPMALLFPIVWQHSHGWLQVRTHDGAAPIADTINGIPEYALDQFTRVGKAAFRRLLQENRDLGLLLEQAGVSPSGHVQAIGDIFFLLEGGAAVRRRSWAEAEDLREPARWLPIVARLGNHLSVILANCQAKARQLSLARSITYQSAQL